ncbi:hypothetical protein D5H75_32835 [Bailinhaonella thermotolerans]|uniref:Uncharacterized protein n=1 Tax=Bailinhaonella thermotolerans TaxID=1070861 RepID=A0A3A4A5Q8_9ACTN|nr:hypothetical protein D5H75_32835 [Bailinhaonella thermotolerans]
MVSTFPGPVVDGGVFVSGLADHLSAVWRVICQSLNADMLIRIAAVAGPTPSPSPRVAPARSAGGGRVVRGEVDRLLARRVQLGEVGGSRLPWLVAGAFGGPGLGGVQAAAVGAVPAWAVAGAGAAEAEQDVVAGVQGLAVVGVAVDEPGLAQAIFLDAVTGGAGDVVLAIAGGDHGVEGGGLVAAEDVVAGPGGGQFLDLAGGERAEAGGQGVGAGGFVA